MQRVETTERENAWYVTGFAILCIRFVQGWVYWGGGSRRFIYAPQKLNPHYHSWMAYKLQAAMPGALLGVNHIVSWLLQHFVLLYIAIILFSLAELISGACLIFGFFTRAAAFVTALLSVSLMIIFGWQGLTCLDEWTMAVCNFSMALTLMISGASVYSIDSWRMRRNPALATKRWFLALCSGPLSMPRVKKLGFWCFLITIAFTLSTYNYYRGAIFTKYHAGPTNPHLFHIALSNTKLWKNGMVSFNAYVNSGNEAEPTHIMRLDLTNMKGDVIQAWKGSDLQTLGISIDNKYDYIKISDGPYGLTTPLSAQAQITLPPAKKGLEIAPGTYYLNMYSIDGQKWRAAIKL